jgi:23S rRNA (cytidine1920-2'-O)/16S rRNA (cytidine1409-2'-O)-methyltransferase
VSPVSSSRSASGAAGFVSRGGIKLDGALDALGVEVAGLRALDAGASTGGFTDCLLRRGAERVIAVDVAYGQLAWTIRNDDRVRVLERTNVRALDLAASNEEPVDLVVADLAFISLGKVRDALLAAATPGAHLVLLVKPQFEAPRERVEDGGVVTDPDVWRQAMLDVAESYRAAGCGLAGAAASQLVGPAGNREFFLHLKRGARDGGDAPIDAAIRDAP